MRHIRLAFALVLPAALGMLAALPAGAAAPTPTAKKNGVYAGTTSQDQPIRFTVSRTGRRVSGLITEDLACPASGMMVRNVEGMVAVLPRSHRFGGSYSYDGDLPDAAEVGNGDLTGTMTQTVRGRFSRPAARTGIYQLVSGTLNAHLTIRDGSGAVVHECDTGPVSYRAKLRRSRASAAATASAPKTTITPLGVSRR